MKFTLPFAVLLALSCAPQLPLSGAPCPCAEGWLCCPGSKVCAKDGADCPAQPAPTIDPPTATVSVSRRFRFASSEPLDYRVEEAAGGAIDSTGLYTAPDSPGAFHIIATRPADNASTRIEVNVVSLRLAPYAGRYGGLSSRPIDGVGEDARFMGPRGGVHVPGGLDARRHHSDGHYYLVDESSALRALRRVDLVTGAVETLFEGTSMPIPGVPLVPVTDGALGTATFAFPGALSLDGKGNLLVADACLVRSVDLATLHVTTLEGDPALTTCTADGWIAGVAADGEDRIFFTVGDGPSSPDENTVIWQKSLSTGAVSILAGELGVRSSTDGAQGTFTGLSLLAFRQESGLAAVMALDDANRSVRGVNLNTQEVFTDVTSASGWVAMTFPPQSSGTMFAQADGTLLGAGWLEGQHATLPIHPTGIAVSGRGVFPPMWIPAAEGTVHRFDYWIGILETVAGRIGSTFEARDGNGESASFALSKGHSLLTSTGDEVYVSEPQAVIRKIDAAGNVTTPWRGVRPMSLAADDEYLYIATDFKVERAALDGGPWELVAGAGFPHSDPLDGQGGAAHFGFVKGMVVTPGDQLEVLDFEFAPSMEQTLLRRVDLHTGIVTTWKTLPEVDGAGGYHGLALGPPGKLLLIVGNELLQIDLITGETESLLGHPSEELQAAVYDAGKHYFLAGTVLYQLDLATQQVTTLVGKEGYGAVRPGALDHALLHEPFDLAVLSNGDVVVLDSAERVLVKVQ